MATGHSPHHRHLHAPGNSPIHRLAAHAKLAALVAFVVPVALTPQRSVIALVVDAAVIIGIVLAARLSLRLVIARLSVIVPFVAFALVLPFFGDGERVEVAGLALSADGLWASLNILAKAAIGATASIVLTATTPVPEILHGLSRLRVPPTIVGVIGFMFRYLDLVSGELARMRMAMVARAHDPRWLWQARPIAASAGALFVRTYERGERVHDAMAARGYTGTMRRIDTVAVSRTDWARCLVPAALAILGLAYEVLS